MNLPTWFRYRQGKAEAIGENCYKLTAPVVDAAFIKVRATGDRWEAAVGDTADGADLQSTGPAFGNAAEAWHAAFELYRTAKIY